MEEENEVVEEQEVEPIEEAPVEEVTAPVVSRQNWNGNKGNMPIAR